MSHKLTILTVPAKLRPLNQQMRLLELENMRKSFEKQMAADQNAIMLKLDADQKALIEKHDRRNKLIQWVLGVMAGVEIIVSSLQLLYPTGLPWLQKPSIQSIPTATQSIPPVTTHDPKSQIP